MRCGQAATPARSQSCPAAGAPHGRRLRFMALRQSGNRVVAGTDERQHRRRYVGSVLADLAHGFAALVRNLRDATSVFVS
jgi:hypothetical protein